MAVPGGVWMLCTGTPHVASMCLGRPVIRESLPMPCTTHACPVTRLSCCEPCLPVLSFKERRRFCLRGESPLSLAKLAMLFLVACTGRLLNRLAGHKHEWVAEGILTRLTAIAVEVGIGLL